MTRYRFVQEHRAVYPLHLLLRTLELSRSAFFAWLRRPDSPRRRRRERLAAEVREAFDEAQGVYGSRKVAEALVRREVDACRNTVADLMREMGLRSKAQRRRSHVVTTDSEHREPVAPNRLGRDFSASRPDEKWVADITYVPTDDGWAYVAAVMDLYSRRIVGWAVSDSLESTLVLDALRRAIQTRRPVAGLTHHSDRGSQYAGGEHRALLAEHGIECSMSRRGDCWDNAPMERFMASLKCEWTRHRRYATVEEVHQSVFKYVEIFYNRRRLHQALGYATPVEFETRHRGEQAA